MSAVMDVERVAEVSRDKTSVSLAKLSKRLHRLTGQAIVDFNMIEAGDKVMVCLRDRKSVV